MTIREILRSRGMGKFLSAAYCSSLVAIGVVAGAPFVARGLDTGRLTPWGQTQVYLERHMDADAEKPIHHPENVTERNQLRNLVDVDGNGIVSLQEYNGFREATGKDQYFNDRLTDDLSKMSPNEVESTIREYEESR